MLLYFLHSSGEFSPMELNFLQRQGMEEARRYQAIPKEQRLERIYDLIRGTEAGQPHFNHESDSEFDSEEEEENDDENDDENERRREDEERLRAERFAEERRRQHPPRPRENPVEVFQHARVEHNDRVAAEERNQEEFYQAMVNNALEKSSPEVKEEIEKSQNLRNALEVSKIDEAELLLASLNEQCTQKKELLEIIRSEIQTAEADDGTLPDLFVSKEVGEACLTLLTGEILKLESSLGELWLLTRLKDNPKWKDIPTFEVKESPKNYSINLTTEAESETLSNFLRARCNKTVFDESLKERYEVLVQKGLRGKFGDRVEEFIKIFKEIEDKFLKVISDQEDESVLISGKVFLMIVLNGLTTDEQIEEFVKSLEAKEDDGRNTFIKECNEGRSKILLQALKLAINDEEMYVPDRAKVKVAFNEFLTRRPVWQEAGIIHAISDLGELKDFVEGIQAEFNINITPAQTNSLEESTITAKGVEDLMKYCYKKLWEYFTEHPEENNWGLKKDYLKRVDRKKAGTTWEDIKAYARFNFKGIAPRVRGEVENIKKYINDLTIKRPDAGYYAPFTAQEIEDAYKKKGGAEEISAVLVPLSVKLYSRFKYLKGKQAPGILSPQAALAQLKTWIQQTDLPDTHVRDINGKRIPTHAGDGLELTKNNMFWVLEEQRSRAGGDLVWEVPRAIVETYNCYGNIWNQLYGRSLADESWGVEQGRFHVGHISMAEIITYYSRRVAPNNKDVIGNLLLVMLVDGNGFCENGKILRALLSLVNLPEFLYDNGDQYEAAQP